MTLLTYEMKVKQDEDSNKKVGVALKSTIQENKKYDQDGNNEDKEIVMFARKFNKFIRMRKYGNGKRPQKKKKDDQGRIKQR